MFKCLRPRLLKNRYTGNNVVCSCGDCDLCLSAKASKYTQFTVLMSHQYKYNFFVTLTYNNKYLPTCSAEVEYIPEQIYESKYGNKVIPGHYKYLFFSDCSRLKNEGELISEYESESLKELEDLELRMHLGANTFCFCSMRDIQNFHKRFNSNINRFYQKIHSNEVCDYKHFTVEDYGGRRLRAHYHMLVCTNSQILAENFGALLSKSWKFGIVNFSVSKGGAERYVSQYVNSFVLVPRILRTGQFKVRQCHSVGLYKRLLKEHQSTIYESDFRGVISDGVSVGKKDDTLSLQGDVSRFCFPKSLSDCLSDYGKLYKVLTIFRDSLQYSSISKQRIGWRDFELNTFFDLAEFLSFEFFDSSCHAPVINFLRDLKNEVPLLCSQNFSRLVVRDFIYRVLLVSKQFFELTSDFIDSDEFEVRHYVMMVYDFYYCKQMHQLKEWYETMEEKLNDSALWLTVLFLFDNFVTRGCRIKRNIFSNKYFHRFIDAYPLHDFHLDIDNISFINDIEFRNRYARSQLKLIRHIKHKELVNYHY